MNTNDAPVLLDASRLVWRRWAGLRPTGIDRICLAWHEEYRARAQAVLVHRHGKHILSVGASRTLFNLLDSDIPRARFRRHFITWLGRNLADFMRPLKGRGRPWLNVGHTGLNLPGLAAWVQASDIRPVLMLHDIIPITHPEFCRPGEKARHVVRVNALIDIASAVLTNSHDTLDKLRVYAASLGKALPPSLAIWPGTPQLPVSALKQASQANDFVILGTIEGRKNHKLLLDVWERLVAQQGESAPRLLIIGRRGWSCEEVLARLDSGRLSSRVVETGPIDDEELARRLAGARALLFPSIAEGYGLPLAEALASGVPVIASDLPVFREIGQGVPLLLACDDVQAWTDAILSYAQPDSLAYAEQLVRLKHFRVPDWQSHFRSVDSFLRDLGL